MKSRSQEVIRENLCKTEAYLNDNPDTPIVKVVERVRRIYLKELLKAQLLAFNTPTNSRHLSSIGDDEHPNSCRCEVCRYWA